MFTYKKRNTFLQNLHPLSGVMLILSYICAFLLIGNPVYLGIILISLLSLSIVDGCFNEVKQYGKLVLPFVVLMMILNPLLVHNGSTVLYKGSINYAVLGPIRITLEAIIYGIFMGIRIICVTTTFGFGNLIIHPDKSFGFFSKYLKKSALLMSMTISLFPILMKSYSNIADVEKLRGNIFNEGTMKRRIKNQGNIVNILFLSSLEDASDMAESMNSRGYGIGKRSSYFYEKIRKADGVIILVSIVSLIGMKLLRDMGLNEINFYPKVENPFTKVSFQGILICLIFYIPWAVNWRWKRWK